MIWVQFRNSVIVSSAVITCEWAKVGFALIFMAWDGTLWSLGKEWTLSGALIASGLPAAMYALQNSLLQLGYRHLDSLTFSMLNQSKLLFTALFMFLILRIKQSSHQVGALAILLGASLLLCIGESSSSSKSNNAHREAILSGVLPTLIASILSGLASTLCQWAAQVKRRSSYLMTIEMSAIGTLCLFVSMLWSPDGQTIRRHGFFYGWTLYTFIPIFTNAIGGILVGLVTTAAGGVRKGFVIVMALLVTALLQLIFEGKSPSTYTWSAMPLVVSSVILYQRYPYREKSKTQ
ncbi:hypothetical protein GOP47_0004385 [Adiantum capillus-veneris]|uniref:Nucleotide-sugar transporter n=1 Tax=Adiantum capillus-veneris TaxID=13818 RepID=A0A9D4ZPI4_ADICA|nr:hypothetical protein GOP47_0004385 [Adiantum capillus-veneris]